MIMEKKLYGFAGKFLRINLTNKTVKVENITTSLVKNFMGGRGIGIYFLYKEVDPTIDVFDPANKIIIANGPLAGTGMPGGTKTTIVTKSALTGGVAFSLASGKFAHWLKFTGYDFVIIEGKAKKPTWIYIKDDKITFNEASDLWGLTTLETREKLALKINPDISVLCIGPGGENLVRMAATMLDSREAGRGGTGAVFGSKLLKAIVIGGPKNKVFQNIYDKESLKKQIKQYAQRVKDDPSCQAYRYMGTSRSCVSANLLGLCPTRNYQETYFEGYKKIAGEILAENYIASSSTCYQCPVVCQKNCEVKEGKYNNAKAEGLDYETMWAFGPECGNSSIESLIMAGMLCDNMGLDSISTGVTIGFAIECFEKGLLSKKDCDGLELHFGNHEAIIKMITKIAYRDGIGDLLAEGSSRAAIKIGKGAEKYSMTVKGQEMAGWDPRGAIGMSLAYGTSTRGGCHTTAAVFSLEIPSITGVYGQLKPDPSKKYEQYSTEGKAELVKFVQDNRAAMSALGACYFVRPLDLNDYARSLSSVTGDSWTQKDLLELGERIYTLEKAFNWKSGLVKKDDLIPDRFYKEEVPYGPTKGHKVEYNDYLKMLREYYDMRGWNEEGCPNNTSKIKALGLQNILTNI